MTADVIQLREPCGVRVWDADETEALCGRPSVERLPGSDLPICLHHAEERARLLSPYGPIRHRQERP